MPEPRSATPKDRSDDPRLSDRVKTNVDQVSQGAPVLIGFPSDEGVRRNGGRIGAADGPAAIRRFLYRLTPDARTFERHTRVLDRLVDLGDIVTTGDLEADQADLGELIADVRARGGIPIIVGGGHETAFGHYLGYASAGESASIINWDAHADVRPLKDGLAHSGSPFRQALEHVDHPCSRYLVAGLQPSSVARAHLEYVHDRDGRTWFVEEVDEVLVEEIYGVATPPTMVTFDLDALPQSAAPGVSAPAAAGLDPVVWLRAARRAGASAAVHSFDICELCPKHDVDGRTARLAALTVWEFLRGLADRK